MGGSCYKLNVVGCIKPAQTTIESYFIGKEYSHWGAYSMIHSEWVCKSSFLVTQYQDYVRWHEYWKRIIVLVNYKWYGWGEWTWTSNL